MAHLGTLRDYKFASDAEDIRGSNVYGHDDEKLGTIDDVIFNHANGEISYLVVETGGWLSSKKFLIPSDRIQPSENRVNDFFAPLTKQQIERFPAYDEKLLERTEDWEAYEREYTMPPLAWEAPDIGTGELRSPAGTPASEASAKTTAAVRERWREFEDALRNNRAELLSRCSVCSPKAECDREVA